MAILLFFTAHWYLSLFTQTFFQHRYAAHRMFTMSPLMERAFFILTYATQGSSFMSPRAYALLHRMHHAYSDTAQDPHSPHNSTNAFTMMWKTRSIYQDCVKGTSVAAQRFAGDYPVWNSLEDFGNKWYSRVGWGAVYVLFYVNFATAWWQYLLLPIHLSMGAVHGAIVNWPATNTATRTSTTTTKAAIRCFSTSSPAANYSRITTTSCPAASISA